MDRRAWLPFFLLALAFGSADAMPFSRQDELNYADGTHKKTASYRDQFGLYLPQRGGDCGHWCVRTLGAGCPGLWHTLKNMGRMNPNCLARNYHNRYKDGLPRLEYLLPYLHDLGFDTSCQTLDHSAPPDDPKLIELFPDLESGDVFIIEPTDTSVYDPGHAVIIRTRCGSAIGYQDHSGQGEGDLADLVDRFWQEYHEGDGSRCVMRVVHPPEKLVGCRENRWRFGVDSTWTSYEGFGVGSDGGRATHQQICCWHENLGGTWPWYSDSTGYACLSWPESSGTVWDSMISPRMNFVGDSAVLFWQKTYSTLQHENAYTIAVKGSTDNGASWPFVLGDDGLTEADLPWANNQRNVRIAWIYKGHPQTTAFWCVDDIEIWAKPARNRDVSVSGVARPYGVISQGRTIVPSAFVWNHGKELESLDVTMRIGSSYSDTRTVMLYPYNDTLLRFEPWTAVQGDYTATAFCAIDSDECRANDTASLNFRVTGDSWVDLGLIYGNNGTNAGGCVATAPDSTLYVAIGRAKEFAKYSPERNLWDAMARTSLQFECGSGLAYPGTGDYLYGTCGGKKRLYRYSMTGNSWDSLTDAPSNLKGGLASGGNGYLYALRGGTGQTFYRYNIANNAWDTVARLPVVPHDVCFLASGGSDYLFAFQGHYARRFYRYSISANTWTQLADAPANVYLGAAMAYCPRGNKLYATFGNGSTLFYEYDIANGTWTPRPSLAHGAGAGAFLAYLDHSVYASCGNGNDNELYRYSLPGTYDAGSTGPLVPSGSILTDSLAVVIPAGTVANNYYGMVNVPARMTITQVQTGGLGTREPKAEVPEPSSGQQIVVAGKTMSGEAVSGKDMAPNPTRLQAGVRAGQISSRSGVTKGAIPIDRLEAGPAGSGKTARVVPNPTANGMKGRSASEDEFTYSRDVNVPLSPNSSTRVQFPACTMALGRYRVVLRTMLSGDENPGNDSTVDSVRVKRPNDVGAIRVVQPESAHYEYGDSILFAVKVQNFDDSTHTFPVKLWVNDSIWETKNKTLAALDSDTVAFASHILAESCYHVKFATRMAGDERPANDTVRKDVIVGPARDAAAAYPITPSGFIASDTPYVVIPTGWVRNNYCSRETIPARMLVGDSCLRETFAIVDSGESAAVTFAPCTLALGSHRISLVTHMAGDRVPGNDSVADTLLVRRPIDVAASRVLAPLDSVYTTEDTLSWGVLVRNGSDRTQMLPVRLLQDDTLLDEQGIMIPGLDSLEVWFDDRPLRPGVHCFKFVACLDSDERRGNDTLAKTIRVKSGDYWVMLDSAPEAQARLAVDSAGRVYAAARSTVRVDFYDPGSNLWNRLSDPPVSGLYGITSINNAVYVLGMGTYHGLGHGDGLLGLEASTPVSQGAKPHGRTPHELTSGPGIWRYEPENDSWAFVTACGGSVQPGSGSNLVGTAGSIYLIGCGQQVKRYFIAADSWVTDVTAPKINYWGAAGWMDGRLYVLASASALSRFDERSGLWSNLPGPGIGTAYGSALACDRAAERAFAFWYGGSGGAGEGFSELRDTGRADGQLTWLGRQNLAGETLGAAMCFGATQGYCLDGKGGFWRYRPKAVFDLAAMDLVMPETVHADTPFVPVAVVQNNWEDSLSCQLTLQVGGDNYSSNVVVPPQSRVVHQFGSMQLSPGTYQTSFQVSTSGGDSIPANDRHSGTLFVPLRHDAAAVQILGVEGWVRYDSLLHPAGVISNLWSDSLDIRVMLVVDSVFLESTVVRVPSQRTETIWFDTCRLSIGTHNTKLGVGIKHDELAQNDTFRSSVNVVGNGWLPVQSAPTENPMLCDGADSVLYAADRYEADFNEYNMLQDSWHSLATANVTGMISLSRAGKEVFGLGLSGTTGSIEDYSTTLGKWSTVTSKLPVSPSNACGLVATDPQTLYLVGPGVVANFWRYDFAGDTWYGLSGMPAQTFNWVSCAFDGADCIYVLTGTSGRVYQYSVGADNWTALTMLPQSISTPAALSIDVQRKLLTAMGHGVLNSARSAEYSFKGCAWSNPVSFPGSAPHPSLTVSNGRFFGTGGGNPAAATFAEYVRVALDVAALDIVALPDTFRWDSLPHPGGVVRNLSWVPVTCQTTLSCGTSQQQQQVQLAPMQYDTVWFSTMTCPPGGQTVSLTVSCTGDENSGNDVYSKQVFVRAPWVPRAQAFQAGRLDSDTNSVSAVDRQGNGVMRYHPGQDYWKYLTSSPFSAGCLDLAYWDGSLYALGGLSSDRGSGDTIPKRSVSGHVPKDKSGRDQIPYAIYRLVPGDTLWQAVCESLPDSTSPGWLIATGKGLYVLPAAGRKLMRYDSTGWTERAQLPNEVVGAAAADWDRSDTFFFTFLSDSGARRFLRYSVTGDTWLALTAPPESGLALAVEPGGNRVLMMTLDSLGSALFEYDRTQGTWTRSGDTPPQAYAGMALCFCEDDAWLLTGGPTGTSSFWQYDPDFQGSADRKGGLGGTAGWPGELLRPCLTCRPNPFNKSCRITYALPKPGRVGLKLYDVSGRLVLVLVNGYATTGSHSYSLFTAHCSLARGIYLLKLESADFKATRKLVVE